MAMHPRAVITNQKFVYQRDSDYLLGKLKYFQYRDDRDTHIQQQDADGERLQRWVDHGLGSTYGEIAANCAAMVTTGLQTPVAARTLVISPQVDMMQAIPAGERAIVMAELTQTTVERWFEEMGKSTPEYAFVVHQGEVKHARPEGIQQEDTEFYHSHVVLAPTLPGLTHDRDDYRVYREHLDILHRVGNEEMERIWTRELGRERVQTLNQELETLTTQLAELDAAREARIHEEITATLHDPEIDAAMLAFYDLIDIEPPEDLLLRTEQQHLTLEEPPAPADHDGRDVLALLGIADNDLDTPSPTDSLAPFRELGFTFPEDDFEREVDRESVTAMLADRGIAFPPDTPDLTEYDAMDLDL